MPYRLAADAALLLHFGFIAFVLFGGALALRWRFIPFIQLPAAAWGVYVEVTGRLCPLTVFENYFRFRAGQSGYAESFIERYLFGAIYPAGITPKMQFSLAGVVLAVNAGFYGFLLCRRRFGRVSPPP